MHEVVLSSVLQEGRDRWRREQGYTVCDGVDVVAGVEAKRVHGVHDVCTLRENFGVSPCPEFLITTIDIVLFIWAQCNKKIADEKSRHIRHQHHHYVYICCTLACFVAQTDRETDRETPA